MSQQMVDRIAARALVASRAISRLALGQARRIEASSQHRSLKRSRRYVAYRCSPSAVTTDGRTVRRATAFELSFPLRLPLPLSSASTVGLFLAVVTIRGAASVIVARSCRGEWAVASGPAGHALHGD